MDGKNSSSWDQFWAKQSPLVKFLRENYFNRIFVSFLHKFSEKNESILEVGCGEASFSKYMDVYYGIDNCITVLKKSKSKFLICGDATNLPIKDSSVDVVWSQGLIEHFDNEKNCINEMLRVSRKGVVGVVPSRLFVPWKVISQLFPPIWPWMEQKFYSIQELNYLLLDYPVLQLKRLLLTLGLCIGFFVPKLSKRELREYYECEGSTGNRIDLMYHSPNRYRSWYHRRRKELTEKELRLIVNNGSSYVEIGCGAGQFLKNLGGIKLSVGVDISRSYIGIAKMASPNSCYMVADAEFLPIKDNSFEVVGCMEVLEHVTNIKGVLMELRRISRDKILITIPTEYGNPIFKISRLLLGEWVEFMKGFNEPFKGHIHPLSASLAGELFRDNLGKLERIVPVHTIAISPIMFSLSNRYHVLNKIFRPLIAAGDFLEDLTSIFLKWWGISTIFVFKKQ
ncbi:MAG: methyltransferase domain-containing protein [Candidatus Altiarchaeota archaeon]